MNEFPSVMRHNFSRVPQVQIERSQFDRSHSLRTTFDAGYLVPIFWDEALPGDSMNLKLNAFARLSTPLKPVMDNLYLDTFFFSVPIRLIWNNWEKFCGAQDDPGDSTSFNVPQVELPAGGPEVGTLSDYLGMPTDSTNAMLVNSLWHRAYNLIWNTWFRDQNLQDSVVVDKDDGPDTYSDYVLLRRGKRHDYFTSCLPWPQKGTAVALPVGASTAPVTLIPHTSSTNPMLVREAVSGNLHTDGDALASTVVTANLREVGGGTDVVIDPNSRLQADLSSALATTVNELREALQTQILLERDARGGTRYCEIINSHFGVTSPAHAVLQRPEFIGGGSTAVNIHPVAMTAMASGGTAAGQQGNLAGYGTCSVQGHGFNKSFVEHCVLIGLASVRADLTYQQGLPRMYSRRTRYDYYWPAFAHLGEQAVLNKEIYADLADGTGANQREGVWGYQEAWAEYRYKPSVVTGIFRSTYATPLDVWHLAQEFGAQPTLDDTFIQDDPPVDRVIAVTTEPHMLMECAFKYICARPMPVNSIPGLGARL